jgi:hypothetical protein
MNKKSVISIIVSFMLLLSGFLVECTASEHTEADVHFIAEKCVSHDCAGNNEKQESSNEQCGHNLCNDKAISDNFLPVQKANVTLFFICSEFLKKTVIRSTNHSLIDIPPGRCATASINKTVVLRI